MAVRRGKRPTTRPIVAKAAVEGLEARRLMAVDDPFISEVMAVNGRTLADAEGDFPDWVEIHNPSAAPVNLAGWSVTDDPADKTKWQFPATTLPAGGYLVVFASDKDRAVAGQPLHTNFKLDGDGEYLALVKPDGATVASAFDPAFPSQYNDISYGVGPAAFNR